jgi:hypothetical protein
MRARLAATSFLAIVALGVAAPAVAQAPPPTPVPSFSPFVVPPGTQVQVPPGVPQPSPQPTAEPDKCTDKSFLRDAVCAAKDATLGALGREVSNNLKSQFQDLAVMMTDAAMGFLGKVAGMINESTKPDIGAVWFLQDYGLVLWVMVPSLFIFTIVGIVRAAVRGSLAEVANAAIQCGVAIGICFVAITGLDMAIKIVDWATAAVTAGSSEAISNYLTGVGKGSMAALTSNGMIGSFDLLGLLICAVISLIGGFFAWFNLLIRGSAIEMLAVFIPVAMVGRAWAPLRMAASKLWWFLGGLVASVFVIAVIIMQAAHRVAAAETGLAGNMKSAATVFFAPIVPWLFIAAIGGVAYVAHAASIQQVPKGMATTYHKGRNAYHAMLGRFSTGQSAAAAKAHPAAAVAAGVAAGMKKAAVPPSGVNFVNFRGSGGRWTYYGTERPTPKQVTPVSVRPDRAGLPLKGTGGGTGTRPSDWRKSP